MVRIRRYPFAVLSTLTNLGAFAIFPSCGPDLQIDAREFDEVPVFGIVVTG
jgi:hypothetical protein